MKGNLLIILYLGTGEIGLPTLRDLLDGDHHVVGVVAAPDRPAGRGRKLRPGPVAQLARSRNVPLFQPESVNEPNFVEQMRDMNADLGVTAAFGQKLGPDLLAATARGCVNIHASLLPAYRGAAPINWAVINREKQSGVTVFQMVEAMDAGAIWAAGATEVPETQTAGELHDRLGELAPGVLREALARVASGESPVPQDNARASAAPKLAKELGWVDFATPPGQLAALVNGLWPWPGAACEFRKADDSRTQRVQLVRARAVPDVPGPGADAPNGTFISDRIVAAGGGGLEILEIKPAGGKLLAMSDFANGYRVSAGDRLTSIRDTRP